MEPSQQGVARWGRYERSFVAAGHVPPTTELVVEFTGPSGRTARRRGFWDGGLTWRVRFMPDEAGEWTFRSRSAPIDPGLHEVVGRFVCDGSVAAATAAGESARFARHGPVRVAASRLHLEHADGTPFLWLADTAWNGPLLSAAEDWQAYLADRAAKGFSAVQFIPMAPWTAAYTNAEGEVAYTANAACPVNPHFFHRIDQRIDAINAAGMLAVPVLLWAANFGDSAQFNPGATLDVDQAVALASYQVARYGAHHVAWLLNGDGVYDGRAADRWRQIGRRVFGGTESAPVGLHPIGLTWPYDAFAGERWLTIAGYQSSHGVDGRTLKWLHSGPPARVTDPPRVSLNLEPCYEGIRVAPTGQRCDARQVRQALYWSLLNAPTAGVSYGAHGLWSWQAAAREPLNHAGVGVAPCWRDALHLPGGEQVRHLADLFGSLPWWKLRPAPELLAEQPGTGDPNRFISSSGDERGEVATFYLPSGGEVSLRASGLRSGGALTWFDPRTGNRLPAVRRPGDRLVAPNQEDWVLLYEAPLA